MRLVATNEARVDGSGHRNVGRRSCCRARWCRRGSTRQEFDRRFSKNGDRDAACGRAKEHRGPMFSTRRDEILRRYGIAPGTHPDYEIDHLFRFVWAGRTSLPISGRSRDAP